LAQSSIIGGGNADFSRWEFTAAILRKGRMHCGGSVIAPTKILTAAHCVADFKSSTLDVVTGRPKLTDRSVGEVIEVASAVAHPDFRNTQLHDVGVITLSRPTSSPPIELASPEEDAAFTVPGGLLRVAGWGARNPFGVSLSNVLKRATERVRTTRRCRKAFRGLFSAESMICSLGRKLGAFGRPPIHSTACSGDSGGPLVADTPAGPREVGTVSYGGAFCGLSAAPTVYSRVSASLDFIQAQL
jgi:secreted trypsin-like serine protease